MRAKSSLSRRTLLPLVWFVLCMAACSAPHATSNSNSIGPSSAPSELPPPNTSSTVAEPVPPAVNQAASNLYNSWKSGDEGQAGKVATASAVRRLFATRWQPKYLPVRCRPSRAAGYECTSIHPGAFLLLLLGLPVGGTGHLGMGWLSSKH